MSDSVDVAIIGGGQAGLAVSWYLKQAAIEHVVLEGGRVGEAWRSLRRAIRADQFEVARRVEVAGAGTRLPASRLSPDRLRRKVREALTRTAGAKRVAEGFAAAGGALAAAYTFETRLIESKTKTAGQVHLEG